LMDTLAKRLVKQGWERCDRRELYRFRQFYLAYPKIVESLTPQSRLRSELSPLLALVPSVPARIRESVTAKSLEAPHPGQACCHGEPLHRTKRGVASRHLRTFCLPALIYGSQPHSPAH
jgi:hypothetical protein